MVPPDQTLPGVVRVIASISPVIAAPVWTGWACDVPLVTASRLTRVTSTRKNLDRSFMTFLLAR
jgi:hypothetical protein